MNAFFLALLALFAVASSVQGESNTTAWSSGTTWSSKLTMQINKAGAHQPAACSETALAVFKTKVGEWIRDELIDLFGKSAFTLGQVTGVEDRNTISLFVSVKCLECSKVTDKKYISYIVMFFMQHMMDEWIAKNNDGILAGCMGEGTTISNVFIGGKKAVSIM
jgi:hypothetical protein